MVCHPDTAKVPPMHMLSIKKGRDRAYILSSVLPRAAREGGSTNSEVHYKILLGLINECTIDIPPVTNVGPGVHEID